jgi:hypothetical protein
MNTHISADRSAAEILHPLDRASRLTPTADGRLRGVTDDAYWNMASPWGGLTAATLMRAMMEHPGRIGEPVSLTLNFCAPVARGEFFVVVRPVRTNRSTQHWYAELTQPDIGVAATATAVFAARRETWSHRPATPPDVPPPESLASMPTGGSSAWLNLYNFRFATGEMRRDGKPGEKPASPLSHVWLNPIPARPLDFLALTALSDIFFIRILQVRGYMVPMGTVSMTTYFHATGEELSALGIEPVLGVADAKIFDRNFADQQADIWSRGGRLLATCYQISWFKE